MNRGEGIAETELAQVGHFYSCAVPLMESKSEGLIYNVFANPIFVGFLNVGKVHSCKTTGV